MVNDFEWRSYYENRVLFGDEGYQFEIKSVLPSREKLFNSGLVDMALTFSRYRGEWAGFGEYLEFDKGKGRVVVLKPDWQFFKAYNEINPEEFLQSDNILRKDLMWEKGKVVSFDKYLRVVKPVISELMENYENLRRAYYGDGSE